MYAIEQEDGLGLLAEQFDIIAAATDLTPLPVPDLIRHRRIESGPDHEAGGVDVSVHTGPTLDRTTQYRFHRRDVLNEHLCHAWPAAGYEYPALTTVIFEMPQVCIIGADWVPIGDVVFDPTYYGRYLLGMSDVLQRHWTDLVAHRLGPEPPPSPYFTNQVGSTMSVLLYQAPAAIPAGRAFLLDLTTAWTRMQATAAPTPPGRAAAVEARRRAVQAAYKALDYHSPASDGLASVLGWPGANAMFDAVFGPDDPDQGDGARRTYLDVAVSPGTPPRPPR